MLFSNEFRRCLLSWPKLCAQTYSGEVKDAFGINYKVPGYDTAGKSGTNELQNSLATNERKLRAIQQRF